MNNFFNKIITLFCVLMAFSAVNAQTGLEGIEVETYYISTAADFTNHGVPLGSKTYRLYANLATNYNLISMYGGPVAPGLDVDSLVFFSSTNFWNLPSDGVNFARSFSDNSLDDGAHLIDSWFSFGGGGIAGTHL